MSELRLRPAALADKPILDLWDEDEAVRFATNADHASDDWLNGEDYWTHELSMQSKVYAYLIGEVCENANPVDAGAWRPFAAMQIIDPHLEPTHYWGDIEPNLRAIDIWIGDARDRNRGWGRWLMTDAIKGCFRDPAVTAIIIDPLNANARAHRFYQRMGFLPTHHQTFNGEEDDCLVHRLTREHWDQIEVARRVGASAAPIGSKDTLGVSRDLTDGAEKRPIHGLRHAREGDACGWYLWTGELSDDADFFVPLHAEHLINALPFVSRYLGLPPGWRFLATETREDVWFDPALLTTRQGDLPCQPR